MMDADGVFVLVGFVIGGKTLNSSGFTASAAVCLIVQNEASECHFPVIKGEL